MLRTKAVKLSVIPAMAFRAKLRNGPSITIQRSDYEAAGIGSISRTSGEAIPSANTNTKMYPPEAFAEALKLTNGLPYLKGQKGVKVDPKTFVDEKVPEEVIVDSEDYEKIVNYYMDKNGKLSYDLLNKDFIKFAKSSSKVRDLVAEGATVAKIRLYIASHKFATITGNSQLSDKEVKKIIELLDETSPKGVFKELNEELKRMLSAAKKQR